MLRRALPDALRAWGRLRAAPGALEPVEASARGFATDAAGGEVGAISGVPDEVYARKVVIYSPARTASQQGMSKVLGAAGRTLPWKIEFDTRQKWENPLIGWTSTADPVENVGRAALSFDSAEAAARFCERHGWAYEIRQPRERRTLRQKRYYQYGDNFSVKRKGIPEGGLISETMKAGLAAEKPPKD